MKRGSWDVSGGFALERNLSAAGDLAARSRLHAGDGLDADFRLGEHGRIVLKADATEGSGGALAGLLGLPAEQRLSVQAHANGTAEAGTLQVRAASGARQPLAADADWSNGNTRVQARLDLDASRLTSFLAARAGRQAVLTATARHLQGDSFQVRAALTAQAANLTLDGPLDWRAQRSAGLSMRLQVADLSRWVPGLTLGATSTAGALSGDVGRFTYKGVLDAHRFARSGYVLDRISGPAEIARRGDAWDLKADLSGAGGAGQGAAAALLGRTPHVRLDGARLADGRLLVRQLDAQGAGLKLSAQGGQGLLGDLSFKGSAQLSNLSIALPRARGVVTAAWSASQARGDTAWRFTLDAGAANLALGVPQADHFIGASPRLKTAAAYGPAGLEVASAQFTGASLSATAKGRLDPRGGLGFDVGWQAKGPFDTGPLEIAGAVSGGGRIAGSVSAPKADLTADLASLALGQLVVRPAHLALTLEKAGTALGGTVAFSGPSAYGPARIRAAFQTVDGGVTVRDLDADAGGVRASGSLALRDGTPSSADLALQARAGAFLSRGQLSGVVRLAQAGPGLSAHIALDGADLGLPGATGSLHAVSLQADGPWSRLPFKLSADSTDPTPWRFAGAGVLDQAAAVRQLTLSGVGRLRKVDIRTLQPAVLRFGPQGRDLALHLGVGGGHADVAAHQEVQAVSASARLSDVSLAALDPDLLGAVNADLTLNGRGGALGGVMTAELSGARTRDAPADLALAARVRAELVGTRLRLTAGAANAQGLKSDLHLDLPVEASAAPFRVAIVRTRPIAGGFSADGELRPLWDLLVGGDQSLSGRVVAQGAVSGSLNAPHATGHAALSAGRYQNVDTGLNLQDFTLNADFTPADVHVTQASGADGHGGKLAGSGDINLARGGASDFKLQLSHFRLIDNDTLTAIASGDVTVVRDTSGAAKVTGAVKIERADVTPNVSAPTGVVPLEVREINRPDAPDETVQEMAHRDAAKPPVTLDVNIRASRGVFVKGKGLNLELSLDAHVTGSLTAPQLSGRANVVLGSYDFAGKRFDFDQRGYVTLATRTDQIRLDLTATREDPTLTAVVKVSGTAAKPDISLSSTPVLPQDEVLSQVLFGSSAAQLSGAQAAELASALASLTGGGGFDFLGRLRQFAGLDRLALGQSTTAVVSNGKVVSGSSSNGGASVSGGKYVGDNVYVELTGGGRTGPSASVEWRVTRAFSILSQVGTQGDAQLSIQFRHNYR